MTAPLAGIGLPTLLLLIQLVVGLLAAADLVRSLLRRRFGISSLGQAIVALVLVTLGADGLFFGTDVVGRVGYELGLDPGWIRPGTIGLVVAGTLLWMTER